MENKKQRREKGDSRKPSSARFGSIDRESTTESLVEKLTTARKAFLAECVFDLAKGQASFNVKQARDKLKTHGCIIIKNFVSRKSIQDIRPSLGSAICAQWGHGGVIARPEDVSAISKGDLNALDKYRNSKGGFGNIASGYLFKQFLRDEDYPTVELEARKKEKETDTSEEGASNEGKSSSKKNATKRKGDNDGSETVCFDYNLIHRVIVDLLTHEDNRDASTKLLEITHPNDGMLSWDSVKVANNHRPKVKGMTDQLLTPPHVDIYGDAFERMQGIINNDTGRTKLCFVPGTFDPETKQLMADLEERPNLYEQHGFTAFRQDQLKQILCQYGIAPPPRALVLWSSSVVHFEACCGTSQGTPNTKGDIFSSVSFDDLPNQHRERYVVSVHRPYNLSRSNLHTLAHLAEHGMCPAFYFNVNNDTKVGGNIMNRKTSLWRIPRTLCDSETSDMNERIRRAMAADASGVAPSFDPLRMRLYGIHD